MLRVLLRVVEVSMIGLIGYNLLVAVFGWRNPSPPPPGTRHRRLRVLIPAHNEAGVVKGLLDDLSAQDYPADRYETWVLADRCSDDTSDVAKHHGARVAERVDGPDGKGNALAWYLGQHSLEPDEAMVILDADNRIPANLLSTFADELDLGHQAIQAYLDVANPDDSSMATASALSYWASNRMVQLARHNLGWQVDLGGTGMCLTAESLQAAGGFGGTAAEDQELSVRLLLAGVRVTWSHDVRVRDEKPSRSSVVIRQRSRWASGRRQVAKRHFGDLTRAPSLASFDMAIRLLQPSRMGVALASVGFAVVSALGAPLLPAPVWATLAGIQFLAPIPFLAREGVAPRYLARYPLLVLLPLAKIPARLIRQRGWYHTPHGESEKSR
jgi:cellulose synthase/poly-beta-1,6-N-acetylglucosamine synthase-like glycosyltransferase